MALHCPATLLLAPAPVDEGGVRGLVESLRGELVMAVVTPPGETRGQRLAELLDAPLETDADLTTDPDEAALLGVADLHRGETVVVLTGVGEGIRRMELGDTA